MITNREEVLENALRVFAKMNYERASQTEIARACGLSKAGLIYYYPLKLDLFVAVADRYVFGMQSAASKLSFAYGSFAEFLEKYLGAVERTMDGLVRLLSDGGSRRGAASISIISICLSRCASTIPMPRRRSRHCSAMNTRSGGRPCARRGKAGRSGATWTWTARQ